MQNRSPSFPVGQALEGEDGSILCVVARANLAVDLIRRIRGLKWALAPECRGSWHFDFSVEDPQAVLAAQSWAFSSCEMY